jgi:hypothetical protein
MHPLRKDKRVHFVPVALAAIIAVAGTAAIFFMDFGPENDVRHNGITMITAATVDRAGATVSESSTH